MPALIPFAEQGPKIEIAALTPAPVALPSIKELIKIKAVAAGINSRVALRIAFCESTYRQFNDRGQVLRGKHNSLDVGLFQINEKFHQEKSRSLGFDIYTTEGNIDYALWLINNEGTRHWKWSRSCWS